MLTILLIIVAVIAAIAFVVGLFKGYVKLSSWGGTVVGTLFFSRLARRFVAVDHPNYGVLMLCITLCILLFLTLIFSLVRRFISKQTGDCELVSFYHNYDAREEHTAMALDAYDRGDRKRLKKLALGGGFSESRGPWGVVDRIFGGITLALNAATLCGLIGCFVMLVVDTAQIGALTDMFQSVLEWDLWVNLGRKCAIDALVIALLCMSIRLGYKNGILSVLGAIIVLALIGGAGFLSYHLAFNVEAFTPLAQSLADGGLKAFVDSLQGAVDGLLVARCIITAGLFLIFLIIVIIISIFVPHIIDKFRGERVVSAVDGFFGAIVLTAILFGILMFLGAMLYQISDLPVFENMNTYFDLSCVSNCLYRYNPLNGLEFIKNLPLRGWFNLPERV